METISTKSVAICMLAGIGLFLCATQAVEMAGLDQRMHTAALESQLAEFERVERSDYATALADRRIRNTK